VLTSTGGVALPETPLAAAPTDAYEVFMTSAGEIWLATKVGERCFLCQLFFSLNSSSWPGSGSGGAALALHSASAKARALNPLGPRHNPEAAFGRLGLHQSAPARLLHWIQTSLLGRSCSPCHDSEYHCTMVCCGVMACGAMAAAGCAALRRTADCARLPAYARQVDYNVVSYGDAMALVGPLWGRRPHALYIVDNVANMRSKSCIPRYHSAVESLLGEL
jgi:hypothetical protein